MSISEANALATLRTGVGIGSWLAPTTSWRTFGMGAMTGDGSSALMTRLFAVRDLALGLAVARSRAETRKTVLRIGVAVDLTDAVAALVAVTRDGAPRASLVGVGAGALFFAALGARAAMR